MTRLAARMAGENRARLTLVRLLCAASIWRTATTRILPLCGTSAWWVTLACLLPGFAVAALLRLAMRLTRTATLTENVRACLGKAGAWVLSIVLAALLLVEGLSGMTALVTVFVEGVGTRGTAFTLALLTGGALLLSLHREGLARAAHFLRWPMAAAAVIVAVCLLPDAQLDHLFPVYGEGEAADLSAMKAGLSLAWPVVLLLTVPPAGQGRLRGAVLPAVAGVAALVLVALIIPQELLAGQSGLAALLLLTAKYAPNALKLLYLCLIMLGIFLSIGASVQLATEHLCAPLKRSPNWLPYAILVVLILLQAGDASRLWEALALLEAWSLLPLTGLTLLCLPIAFVRRKRL